MLKRIDFNGNSHVGVYCRANNEVAFVHPFLERKEVEAIENALEIKVAEITIGGSSIIGSLMAMNSNGMVIADLVEEEELKKIEENFKGEILIIQDKFNAAGNNILVNDYGAIVHPLLKDETIKEIERVMEVKAKRATIAGITTVGMAAVATNRGVLCHPKVGEEEIKMIEEVMGVEASAGTVNHGMPYVGAGLVANIRGAITGSQTTGIELNRIEDALDLIGD